MSALFLQKSARHRKDFFKADHFKTLDKKNPERAISEFFLTFNEETEQFQDKILQLLVPNSKRLRGYTQMDVLFLQKAHTTRRSQEALHGFTQESTRTTLVPTRQDLKEQDEASRTQP